MSEEVLENKPFVRKRRIEESPFSSWIERNFQGDKIIWITVLVLLLIGILAVYSATGTLAYRNEKHVSYYFWKHVRLVILAVLAMWITHRIDYRYFSRLSRVALLIAVPLLLLTWKFGVNINEASRWIQIPLLGNSFQPSDLAKLALISTIAAMLAKRQENIDDFQETVLPIMIWTGIICTLIGLSDISSALLLFLTCFILLFIGRVPVSQLMLLLLVGVVSIMLSLYLGQRASTAETRMEYFWGEDSFQEEQANIAITSGGVFGKGPGNSSQRNFLPNPFSDFIYAILIEEYGLLGGIFVLGLYLMLLYRGIIVVATSSQAFGGILCAGLTLSIVIQALLNMAVNVGLVPITGVPLPLVSMGGTSLLFTGIALGIILSISRGNVDESIEVSLGKPAKNTRR